MKYIRNLLLIPQWDFAPDAFHEFCVKLLIISIQIMFYFVLETSSCLSCNLFNSSARCTQWSPQNILKLVHQTIMKSSSTRTYYLPNPQVAATPPRTAKQTTCPRANVSTRATSCSYLEVPSNVRGTSMIFNNNAPQQVTRTLTVSPAMKSLSWCATVRRILMGSISTNSTPSVNRTWLRSTGPSAPCLNWTLTLANLV